MSNEKDLAHGRTVSPDHVTTDLKVRADAIIRYIYIYFLISSLVDIDELLSLCEIQRQD